MAVYLCFCLAYGEHWLNLRVTAKVIQYVGLGLMVAGIALREWAIIILGRQFSVVIAIEADHRLITDGPYRRLRHPAYTGGLVATMGFALALGSWLTVIPIVAILLLAFSYRIRLEEELLLTVFGDTYRDYISRTWRLFPGW
jgi:protein-S-isoprenylcysteine O-methyltransferase Ste14